MKIITYREFVHSNTLDKILWSSIRDRISLVIFLSFLSFEWKLIPLLFLLHLRSSIEDLYLRMGIGYFFLISNWILSEKVSNLTQIVWFFEFIRLILFFGPTIFRSLLKNQPGSPPLSKDIESILSIVYEFFSGNWYILLSLLDRNSWKQRSWSPEARSACFHFIYRLEETRVLLHNGYFYCFLPKYILCLNLSSFKIIPDYFESNQVNCSSCRRKVSLIYHCPCHHLLCFECLVNNLPHQKVCNLCLSS